MAERGGRIATALFLAGLALGAGGIVRSWRAAAALDELLIADDRLAELLPQLAAGPAPRTALDLAEEVALRRALTDLLTVLQRRDERFPAVERDVLAGRIERWFEQRADPALAEEIRGRMRNGIRWLRADRRSADLQALVLLGGGALFAGMAQIAAHRRRPRSAPMPDPSAPSAFSEPPSVPAPAVPAHSPGPASPTRPASDPSGLLIPLDTPPVHSERLAGRVLLVEDNPINQRVTGRQLAELGVDAEIVADGESALARLAETAWDAVLMDLQLPGIDGLEATRRWRRRELDESRRHVPIIAITANALGSDRDACRRAGMDGYLAKPARLNDLRRVLARFLAGQPGSVAVPAKPAESSAVTAVTAVTAVPADQPPLYDPDLWQRLRAETAASDPRLLEDLVADLRAQAPHQLDACREAFVAGDLVRLRAIAHRLKGSSGMLGLARLAAAAKGVEAAAHHGDGAAIRQALDEIRAVLADTLADPAVSALR